MPDFAMCTDDACPSRTHCERHAHSGTRPAPRQAFASFHRPDGEPECSHYVPTDQDEQHLPASEVGA